jgi:hypothetical protein
LDFWDLTKLIFRRWKIALPLLLLTIVASGYIGASAKPDYVMTAYVQIVPASISPTDNPATALQRNPWSQLGLNTVAQAAIYATQDQEFLDSLKAGGHTQNYTLTLTYPDPIVTIQVVGTTPADATDTSLIVIKRFRDSITALQKQSGVKDPDLIGTARLDQGQNLKPSTGKVKRSVIAIFAAGLMLTGGVTIGFDAVTRRRARRRAEQAKVNPLAVEIALAREAAAVPSPDGKELPVVQKVPGPRTGAPPLPESALVESPVKATQVLPRTPDAIEPAERPVSPAVSGTATAKPGRTPLQAGTYRSMNAATAEPEEEPAPEPPPAETAKRIPSDMTIVLQPGWTSGENGNKKH